MKSKTSLNTSGIWIATKQYRLRRTMCSQNNCPMMSKLEFIQPIFSMSSLENTENSLHLPIQREVKSMLTIIGSTRVTKASWSISCNIQSQLKFKRAKLSSVSLKMLRWFCSWLRVPLTWDMILIDKLSLCKESKEISKLVDSSARSTEDLR